MAELHPSASEGLILAADHRKASSGWPLYPTIFFYSGMKGYNLPVNDRNAKLATMIADHPEMRWAMQTRFLPQSDVPLRSKVAIFSRTPVAQPPLNDELEKLGFAKVAEGADFAVFHRP